MAETHLEAVRVSGQGLTLSLIVWRRFRRPMPGMVERILDMNPGLSDLGVILPLGAQFNIPVPVESETLTARERVRLW